MHPWCTHFSLAVSLLSSCVVNFFPVPVLFAVRASSTIWSRRRTMTAFLAFVERTSSPTRHIVRLHLQRSALAIWRTTARHCSFSQPSKKLLSTKNQLCWMTDSMMGLTTHDRSWFMWNHCLLSNKKSWLGLMEEWLWWHSHESAWRETKSNVRNNPMLVSDSTH